MRSLCAFGQRQVNERQVEETNKKNSKEKDSVTPTGPNLSDSITRAQLACVSKEKKKKKGLYRAPHAV